MHITFNWEKLIVENGPTFLADCKVRNEINGERKPHQVVRTIEPNGVRRPYMPRTIPSGIWQITGVQWIHDTGSEYYPVIIRTDAWRRVYIWALSERGKYDYRTRTEVIDEAYHIHFAWYNGGRSRTTHGCINMHTIDMAINFAEMVESEKEKGENVSLEVM